MEYLLSFGQGPPVAARGNKAGDTLVLEYSSGGSAFVLEVSPQKLVHKTVGDGLSLEFIEGKRTEGTLRCGAYCSPYPIFCSRLKVEGRGEEIAIEAVFFDGDIRRKITARITRAATK